jgi:c-di-GMP-binding flagellar brake protein YcgR
LIGFLLSATLNNLLLNLIIMPATPQRIAMANRLDRNLGLLQSGSMITIDITTPAGQKAKFRSTFIGYLPKKYVMVQYPDMSKVGKFSQYITQGIAITVRGLIEGHEGAVVAFMSTVKQTLQIPSRIIVLEFPRSVSLQSLRSAIRIDTDIVSKIKIAKEYWQATMVDISVNGCQILINNGESLMMEKDKSVELVVEDFQGIGDLRFAAKICSYKSQSNGICIGLEFEEKSKKSVIKLLQHTVIADTSSN